MIIDEEDYLEHYGILRKSGRYPWGSGGNVEKRSKSFLDYIKEFLGFGMSEAEIARGLSTPEHPFTTTDLRAARSIARNKLKQANIAQAQRYKDRGWSNVEIGKRMGIPESSVRDLLRPGAKDKADVLQATSDMLKRSADEKTFVDVGTGVETQLGIARNKLDVALAIAKEDGGYQTHTVKVRQLGTGEMTRVRVLTPPGYTQKDVWQNRDNIKPLQEFSETGGRDWIKIQPPKQVSSERVAINYAEDGGSNADGVIYVRRGVDDLSLGKGNYAQVRIAVDGTHYLKGMAVYKDDMPDGVDLVFNTNKKKSEIGSSKVDAMKELKSDPENPFGAVIRQIKDDRGNVSSAMNLVYEEGKWEEWSKSLSSQVLSKQKPALAKQQLDKTYNDRKKQFDEIMSLTNPIVRERLLESFADDVDAASVHLKAAHMPRQRTQVILPVESLKDTEIYAPNFRDGENVVLIRYPHGGKFEIPELKVNNRQREAKNLIGQATDAVAINHRVAERLSGADFDGDTVLVIPNNSGKISTAKALSGLKDFDPQRSYPAYEGMPRISDGYKQNLMGQVSNLITDMTIQGASDADLAKAVRHSMVVIDAEKHHLNYKQSAIDNSIDLLKRKYQGVNESGRPKGASTIVSRATSGVDIPDRKPRSASKGGPIDKVTGELRYEPTGATKISVDSKGNRIVVPKTKKVDRLSITKDAHDLSSGQPIEKVYADHSNRMKALANQARREFVNTKPTPYSPSANKTYAREVKSLEAKLNLAKRNRPRERHAQIMANAKVNAKVKANPSMDREARKKEERIALEEARIRTGAKKNRVKFTPTEWDAIQAGAISNSKLRDILKNADVDEVKKMAQPKVKLTVSPAKKQRAQAMLKSGRTQAEVADALGIALGTLKDAIYSE